jgi:cyclophilin family peptidyl-prolyl cis-trans isomerase
MLSNKLRIVLFVIIIIIVIFGLFGLYRIINTKSNKVQFYIKGPDDLKGNIEIELYPDKAPITVDNFKNHVMNGSYDNTIFHRVIYDFMMQGGDFQNQNGSGGYASRYYGYCKVKKIENTYKTTPSCEKEEWTIPDEINNLKHEPYVISMAKSLKPDTGGSQFFIMFKYADWLDGVHTVFGKVTKGFDLIDNLSNVKTNTNDKPLIDIKIVSAKII